LMFSPPGAALCRRKERVSGRLVGESRPALIA
jgi:hypothetical protein